MPKVITSIGDARDLGCCILGLRASPVHGGSMDEMLGISAVDDDAFSIVDDPANPYPLISDFEPVFTPPTAPALAIPEPGPGGSLTLKANGWARGDGTYIVQSGDTLSGLARLYLGDAARFREIWNLQSPGYRGSRTPDRIVVGDQLVMPNEAVLKAKALGVFTPKIPSSSASSPASSPAPSAPVPVAVVKPAASTPPVHKAALGIGSALAAGIGLLLWRPQSSYAHQKPRKRARRRR